MDKPRRCILGVFAHPDDEAPGAGGTFTRYAREGVQIYVATATLGEKGALGPAGRLIRREELVVVREKELRSALRLYAINPPILMGYRDQEVAGADFEDVVSAVRSLMERLAPDVVITFGPTGITGHDDHIAVHRATAEAFHQYRDATSFPLRLMYIAIPKYMARRFELELQGPEAEPSVLVDISHFSS